ncbi:MAG: Rieske 2Fe-2S domain-containing protein [Pseudomonadota bacterium]
MTRNWYVIGLATELGAVPVGRRVCGLPVALFRDGDGRARATGSICPHRGADLAQGRLVAGRVQCPFHGLEFDGTGRCVRVPSQPPGAPIATGLQLPTYPIVEQQGLLWIWPDPSPPVPSSPASFRGLDASVVPRHYFVRPRTYGGSYLNVVENALDGAHLAFVHTRSVPGAPESTGSWHISMAPDGRGFEALAVADSEQGSTDRPLEMPSRAYLGFAPRLVRPLIEPFLGLDVVVRYTFSYDLSGRVCFHTTYRNGCEDFLFAFLTPSEAEKTLVFAGHSRARGANPVADWAIRSFMEILVEEDGVALDKLSQEARGPAGLMPPAVIPADRTSLPFRRLYGRALRAEEKSVPWALGRSTGEADS